MSLMRRPKLHELFLGCYVFDFVWADLKGSCKVRVCGQREAQNSAFRDRVKTKVIGTLVPDHLGV